MNLNLICWRPVHKASTQHNKGIKIPHRQASGPGQLGQNFDAWMQWTLWLEKCFIQG